MKKSCLLFASLLAIVCLSGCSLTDIVGNVVADVINSNSNGNEKNNNDNQGEHIEDIIAPEFAVALMDAAGESNIYPELVKIKGGAFIQKKEQGLYTGNFSGFENFKIEFQDPSNFLNKVSLPCTKTVVVQGYIVLKNGVYTMKHLSAELSPNGNDFSPVLLEIENNQSGDNEDENDAVLTKVFVSSNYRTFYKGAEFVAETVVAEYSDGSSSIVNANFSGYDMSKSGTQTVTVTFTDKITVSTTYEITVLDQEIVITQETSKYVFENNLSDDNGGELNTGVLKTKFENGLSAGDDIVTYVTLSTKVYDGKNSTLKLSSSSVNGSFTFTVSKSVNKITINASSYKASEDSKLKVNGTSKEMPASFEDIQYDLDATNTIKIEAENRVYIKSIDLISLSGGSTSEKILESISLSDQKTNYSVGETFSFTGTCTAHYSDGSTKTVTPTNVSTPDLSTEGNKTITVSYSENGTTKTVYYTISVKKSAGGDTDTDGYYGNISGNSSSLLDDLRKLNSSKRKTTVGYKPMLTHAEDGFYVTDPGNGPGTITSFYSGKSITGTDGLNREHVWPNSRGGSAVENDIHMTRPTLSSENGDRGNSFYVEGKCSASGGWDPAATSFGIESYRGDAARIIFYCVVASNTLSLVDKEDDNQNNKTMGKLSDLLKWNLKYPVLEREKIRNSGAEKLQGNRNPFIDHPEYACKIWGNTNSTTKSICGLK